MLINEHRSNSCNAVIRQKTPLGKEAIENTVIIRKLQQQDYVPCWHAMQQFTNTRTEESVDEIWTLEHPPVFTQGQNGKPEHLLNPGNIPVIAIDRGGQITYHGPGQLVIYTLIDIKRKKMNVRDLVTALENSVIQLLSDENIQAYAKRDAPGVYVANQKICSIGLRIRRGSSYHGLSFNIDMDLEPFLRINPCGFQNLQMTQCKTLGINYSLEIISQKLLTCLTQHLNYTQVTYDND